MRYQFYIDPRTLLPHCYKHSVNESEAIEVIETATELLQRIDDSFAAQGETTAGRILKVIYRETANSDLIFVITAYDLIGVAKRAYQRRNRR